MEFKFKNDGFKILQIADTQEGARVSPDTLALINAAIEKENPDLIVYSGDQIWGKSSFKGDAKKVERVLRELCEPAFSRNIPFAVCFGNHDSEAYGTHSRQEISDLWADPELKYSLYQEGPEDVDGYGNHIIKVKNSKGLVKNAFFMLDSHDYIDGDILGIQWKYDNIHENQIQWYKDAVLSIDAKNKAIDSECPMFSSLAFFHIPLEEYGMAWNEFKENNYQGTENVKYFDGWYHESDEKSYCGVYPDNMFETMLELGSTKGIFCGHDHINNASLEYKGIRLTYGMSIDYLAYTDLNKKGAQRGCTVITLSPDGKLSVSLENYYQDKYPSKYEKEEVTMQW